MNANTQTNQSGAQTGSQYNTGQSNNSSPQTSYPKKRSLGTIILGIVLILMGTSYIVNKFLPWVFDWLDSGLVVAGVAIVVGFGFLVKK